MPSQPELNDGYRTSQLTYLSRRNEINVVDEVSDEAIAASQTLLSGNLGPSSEQEGEDKYCCVMCSGRRVVCNAESQLSADAATSPDQAVSDTRFRRGPPQPQPVT